MGTKLISTNIANGTIHYPNHETDISEIEWVNHSIFEGVYLKHMIKGSDTNGLFSSHLVKIDPGCALETHCHDEQMELHEVIEGKGILCLAEETVDYHTGKIAVTPKGIDHRVEAGENGLTLLAKFFPALI